MVNPPDDKNIVSLDDFRKKKKKVYPPALTFEPGQYYIRPDLGVLVHCVFLTDKFHAHDGQPTYIMEDQFGNIFAEKMEEGATKDWHQLMPDVFITTVERLKKENDPDPPAPQSA